MNNYGYAMEQLKDLQRLAKSTEDGFMGDASFRAGYMDGLQEAIDILDGFYQAEEQAQMEAMEEGDD